MSDSEYEVVPPKQTLSCTKKASAPARNKKAPASTSSAARCDKQRRRSSSAQHDTVIKKKPKTHDVFGLSHGADHEAIDGITSYFVNRVANGTERRTARFEGEYVLELKVYRADDVADTDSKELWRKALLRVKLQTTGDSDQWKMLQKLVTSSDKLFEDEPHFYSDKINIS